MNLSVIKMNTQIIDFQEITITLRLMDIMIFVMDMEEIDLELELIKI